MNDWTPAMRIGRRPGNVVFCEPVMLRYSRPEAPAAAAEKAIGGRTVFVRREDADAVLAAIAEAECADSG